MVSIGVHWLEVSGSLVPPQVFLNSIGHVTCCHDIAVEWGVALGTEQSSHGDNANKVVVSHAFTLAGRTPLGCVELVDPNNKVVQRPCLLHKVRRELCVQRGQPCVRAKVSKTDGDDHSVVVRSLLPAGPVHHRQQPICQQVKLCNMCLLGSPRVSEKSSVDVVVESIEGSEYGLLLSGPVDRIFVQASQTGFDSCNVRSEGHNVGREVWEISRLFRLEPASELEGWLVQGLS
ncbi:MAG: hypothetical protein J3Q66DRAFT_352905 [Benniella sp.]|nr:MAG: hypothetical protein J3Q66DRAFT_352905 [Benniella sp.]